MTFGPILLTLGASLFTFAMTTLGSSFVFLIGRGNKKKLTRIALGFSAGIMMAASVFGLLLPAMEQAAMLNMPELMPVLGGFLLGVVFLFIIDKSLPHQHLMQNTPEGPHIKLNKHSLLFIAITIHNIPEGLCIGVSAAAALSLNSPEMYSATLILALGLGIQNLPEGAAVSLPFYSDGYTKKQSFIKGTLSGIAEPVAALVAVILTASMTWILPWALSFSAGAMLYVVTEELIPQSQEDKGHSDAGTISILSGFLLMMALDIGLG